MLITLQVALGPSVHASLLDVSWLAPTCISMQDVLSHMQSYVTQVFLEQRLILHLRNRQSCFQACRLAA